MACILRGFFLCVWSCLKALLFPSHPHGLSVFCCAHCPLFTPSAPPFLVAHSLPLLPPCYAGLLLKFCALLLLANGLTGLIMAVMSAAHQHPALEPRCGIFKCTYSFHISVFIRPKNRTQKQKGTG